MSYVLPGKQWTDPIGRPYVEVDPGLVVHEKDVEDYREGGLSSSFIFKIAQHAEYLFPVGPGQLVIEEEPV
jgi:hypothetical protein